jgi:hypothetical protein
MGDLILTTYDWVPDVPRGYVRDLRVRWALEEAGFPYRVESTPFRARGAEHFANQPFGQAPWLTDGDISIFESGAILLHGRDLEIPVATASLSNLDQLNTACQLESELSQFTYGREPKATIAQVKDNSCQSR